MLSTIEITPSHVSRFFAYFAVLSLVMSPAAVAFARKKTSRWFLLSVGLLLLIGGALNWWGLLPNFSWNGYEPDWPPICVGASWQFSVTSDAAADGKDEILSPCLWIIASLAWQTIAGSTQWRCFVSAS
jgi:hypothetical protein